MAAENGTFPAAVQRALSWQADYDRWQEGDLDTTAGALAGDAATVIADLLVLVVDLEVDAEQVRRDR